MKPFTHPQNSIDHTVDATERRFNGAPSSVHEAQVADTIAHTCRNCGRAVQSVMEEFCGKPDCDDRAAFARIRIS